jgi:ATP-dependent helicase HrpB
LEEVACVIFDEFHERNLASDLGLGMVLEVRRHFREELRVLVMSATISDDHLSKLMPEASFLECEGRQFPISIEYQAGTEDRPELQQVCEVIRTALKDAPGNILVFLPGKGEILKTLDLLKLGPDIEVLPLYGQMNFEEQRKVLQRGVRRRVILATDIAESSLTLPDIRTVIDAGFCRTPVYDPQTQMSRLKTRRISLDSADQRAGRAGRTAEGKVIRLWSLPRHRMLSRHREPEILHADLDRMVLELAGWGGLGSDFPWLTPPPEGLWSQSVNSLTSAGALADQRLTSFGQELLDFAMSPRLAKILLVGKAMGEVTLAVLLVTWWQSSDVFEWTEVDLEQRLKRFGRQLQSKSSKDLEECKVLCRQMGVDWSLPSLSSLGLLLVLTFTQKSRAGGNSRTVHACCFSR